MQRDNSGAISFMKDEIIDKMTIIGLVENNKNTHDRYWSCKCQCGGTKVLTSSNLFKRKGTSSCDNCCRGPSWNNKKVGQISGVFWSHVLKGAEDRNILVEINVQQAWDKFVQQNGKCSLSGININFKTNWKTKDGTASLDRIDSSKGYTIDNIQWVHKTVNLMKNVIDQSDFISWCDKISQTNNKSRQEFPHPCNIWV